MKTTAFVIGNGLSRKPIDLKILKKFGSIYGCNALYREFSPDHLIAVDTKMIKEINDTSYQLTNSVWSNRNSTTVKIKNLNIFDHKLGWSSGPSALHLASSHNFKKIFIIGFDFRGAGVNEEFLNNVYADTPNYRKSTQKFTYYGNWIRQTANIINSNPLIKYTRVIVDKGGFVPSELEKYSNLTHITVDKFKEKFDC